jgi:hypothetical protein
VRTTGRTTEETIVARQMGFVRGAQALAMALALSACNTGAVKGGGPVPTTLDHPLRITVDSDTLAPTGVETDRGVNAETLKARPRQTVKWELGASNQGERRFQLCFISDDNPIHPGEPRCYRATGNGKVIQKISRSALASSETSKEFKYEIQVICRNGQQFGNCGRQLDPVIIVER